VPFTVELCRAAMRVTGFPAIRIVHRALHAGAALSWE
jgi:hypothetical protein